MSTTDLEKEKIALADKMAQRKANTLGPDYSVHEEPFGTSSIVLRNDIFSETPTASSNFASPNYGDDGYGGGAVATRHNKVMLYSVPSSSIDNAQSAQTFMAVHSIPESDDPVDVERVRVKHLVPPDLSPGRGHADDDDVTTRGFELALFPAYDNGGALDAYVGFGPIPITADPTAENGIGNDARWTVDYASGIVRLTGSPISGESGVFNPFNVFGDRDGTTNSSGRFSLFATFYQYTGPTLTDSDDVNIVTVGDGTDSYGNYYGPTSTVMQMAVDSLSPFGGTVFVKEGNYSYDSTVHIPTNVRVIGLSHRAHINKPQALPAFRIFGSSSAIKGLTIYGYPTHGSRGMIEVNVDTANELLETVDISDNYFYVSTVSESAIELNPVSTLGSIAVYRNFLIRNNVFRPYSTGNRVTYITERLWSGINGQFRLDNFKVEDNDFGSHDGYAVDFSSNRAKLIEGLILSKNFMSNELDIRVRAQDGMHQSRFTSNLGVGNFETYHATDSVFSGNAIDRFFAYEGLSGCSFSDDMLGDITLDGYIEDLLLSHVSAGKLDVYNSANNILVDGSMFSGPVSIKGDGTNVGENLLNIKLTNNQFFNDLRIACELTGTGAYVVKNFKLEGNTCEQSILVGADAESTVTDIDLSEVRFANNVVGNLNDVDALVFGTAGGNASIHLNHISIKDNNLYGSVVFTDQSATSYANMDFDNNKFITAYRGVRIDSHWSLNNISLTNNRIHHIHLLNESTDITGNHVARNILVKDNTVTGAGYIELVPTGVVSGTLKLQNLVVDGNIFEDAGHIGILDSSAGGQNYILDGISVNNNELKYPGSYIRVFGTGLLGGSATTSRISIENNVTDVLFVGGGPITDGTILGNYASETIQVFPESDNLAFTDNSAPYIEFNGNLSQSTLNDNNIYAFGMLIDADFDNVVMSDNNIDGYITFNSSFTDSTLNDNAITGALSFSTATRSTMSGNSVGGTWTNTTWDKSVGSNNAIDGNMTITNLTDSIISKSRVGGNLSAGTLDDSKLSDNIVSNTLTAGALTDSDVVSNEAGTISLSSTITTSHVDNNISRSSMTLSGAISNSTVNGNVTEILDFGSTINNSVVSGNTAISNGNTPALTITGAISSSSITSNVFEAESLTTGSISMGNMTDVVFSDNRLSLAGSSTHNINFGDLTRTRVSNCLLDVDNDTITFGVLTDSAIEDCEMSCLEVDITTSSTSFTNSHIRNCHINGVLDINCSSPDDAMLRSSISGNVIGDNSGPPNNVVVITGDADGSHAVLQESHISNNVIDGNFFIEASDNTVSTLALDNSTISGNTFTGNVDIDYGVSSATPTTLILDSVIDGNIVEGDLLIAQDMSTAGMAEFVNDTTISNNRVVGAITLAPSGRADDQVTYSKLSLTNNICDSLSANGALIGSVVKGNTTDATNTFGELRGVVFAGNIVGAGAGGTLILDGGITQGASFSNNVIVGTLTINNDILSSMFEGNSISSAFSMSDDIDDTSFSDNRFMSSATFTGQISDTVFDSNDINSLDFSTGSVLADVSITNNRTESNLVIDGASQNNTIINGNNIDGTMTLSASTQNNITVVGNNIDGLTIGSAIDDFVFIGNDIEAGSTSITGTLSDASISNNKFTTAINIAALTRVSLSNNVFGTSLSISGAVNESAIATNSVTGTLTFTSTLTNTTILGNTISGSFALSSSSNITDSIISGNKVGTTFGASAGNYTYEAVKISDNVFSGTVTLGCRFVNSSFAGNTCESTTTFTNNSTTQATVYESVVTGNVFENTLTISQTGTLGGGQVGSFYESVFTDNVVSGAVSITTIDDYALYNSVLANNTFASSVTITNSDGSQTMVDSIITDNYIGSYISIDNTTQSNSLINSNISNNSVETDIIIAPSLTGVASGNALGASVISNNSVASDILIAASSRNAASLTSSGSIISGNRISNALNLRGNSTDCNVSGNSIGTSTIIGSLTTSRFSDNHISSSATFSDMLSDTLVNSNVFEGAVTTEGWQDVNCSNNTFLSTFLLSTNDNPAVNRIAFNGNVCQGAVTFERVTSGGTNNFTYSSWVGNVIVSSLTVGGSSSNEMQGLMFTGNSGPGSLTLDTSAGSSELDGVVIVGNAMTGGLSLLDSFSVPTSGHGGGIESELLVALNLFSSYSGVTFTNHAIGWGNSSGANTGTTVGSNY